MSGVPFHRKVLSAALDWHAINELANTLRDPVSLKAATQMVCIAAELHRDPVKIRCAAWRVFTRCDDPARDVLLMFLETKNPLKLADLTAKELERDERKERKGRRKLLSWQQ